MILRNIFVGALILFVLEILLLIEIGSAIGGFLTLVLVFLSSCVGIAIIKMCFKQAMMQLQKGMVDVRVSFLPIAGFLFLFPGFISDVLALLLVMPFIRNAIANVYAKKSDSGTTYAFRDGNSDVFTDVFDGEKGNTIDGTAKVIDSEKDTSEVISDVNSPKTSNDDNKNTDAEVNETESSSKDKL